MLDTDVVVAAFRSPAGASAEILRRIDRGAAALLLSLPLALEYEATCLRSEHRQAAGLSLGQAKIFVDANIALAEPVEIRFRWRPVLKDPGDEMVLETAVNGGADALVTFNRRDFAAAHIRFGIDVFLPKEILQRI